MRRIRTITPADFSHHIIEKMVEDGNVKIARYEKLVEDYRESQTSQLESEINQLESEIGEYFKMMGSIIKGCKLSKIFENYINYF